MKTYSSYKFYISQYGGEVLTEFTFVKAARKASAFIDRITFGRAESYTETPEHELQVCVCEMAEAIRTHEKSTESGRVVLSASNQGYSETYASPRVETATQALEANLYEIARLYLPADLLELNVEV